MTSKVEIDIADFYEWRKKSGSPEPRLSLTTFDDALGQHKAVVVVELKKGLSKREFGLVTCDLKTMSAAIDEHPDILEWLTKCDVPFRKA